DGTQVAAVAVGGIGNVRVLVNARLAALIGRPYQGGGAGPLVDDRAARQRGHGRRWAAVVLERAELRTAAGEQQRGGSGGSEAVVVLDRVVGGEKVFGRAAGVGAPEVGVAVAGVGQDGVAEDDLGRAAGADAEDGPAPVGAVAVEGAAVDL